MGFDRKIRYWEYRSGGKRLRGAGFAKLELRDGLCDMTFQIRGLHRTDNSRREVYAVGTGKEGLLCHLEMQEGRGDCSLQLSAEDLTEGISYGELLGMRIPLEADSELYCKVQEGIVLASVAKSEVQEKEVEVLSREFSSEEQEVVLRETELPMPPPKQEKQCMMEDKWRQLSELYPRIRPFQDEREYLRLNPEDFVILNHRFYKLVHNSFLLHGYYNYRHLILTRAERQGAVGYYIGVPGNFYDREKQVAVMYGFESFESRSEPAGAGDFGYYMIRVEL